MLNKIISMMLGVTTAFAPAAPAAQVAHNPNPQGTDVVIRVGEYEEKAGKRMYVPGNYEVPDDIPLRHDERGYYISEWDINLKLSRRINDYLQEMGANTVLQVAAGKHQDLNAAGRIARAQDPTIYYSVHHNYVDNQNVSGYVYFVNPDDQKSMDYVELLTEKLSNNPGEIAPMQARAQDRYIGEMNETPGDVNILFEGGFFSNVEKDLKVIMSDEQVDFVAKQTAEVLIDILNKENQKAPATEYASVTVNKK